MNRLILSGAALLLTVGSALAADLAVQKAPPLPPPPLWTGPFLGVSIGAGFGSSGNSVSGKDLFCTQGWYCPTPIVEQDFIVPGGSSNGASIAGGAQLGYNWQFNPYFVLGCVIDVTGFDRSGSATGSIVLRNPACATSGRNSWIIARIRRRASVE